MNTLYFFSGACALVPHIVARELALDIQAVPAPLAGEDGRDAYLKNVNELGAVPAYQEEDGFTITQNIAIVEYFASLGQQKGLANVVYPTLGTREHAEALRWLSFANSDVHVAFKPLFATASFGTDESTFDALRAGAKARLNTLYTYTNTLYEGKEWIANNAYSPADIYLYVTLRWAHRMGIDLTQWSNIVAMIQRIEQRPAVLKGLEEQVQPLLNL